MEMKPNPKSSNEPTVGDKFFENIPPVGSTYAMNKWRNSSGLLNCSGVITQ
jgi:hypothetical protein